MDTRSNPALEALDKLVARLHAQSRIRVWSLVVTFFGDAVVPRGGRAGLAAIQAVMERLGVEKGAVRTAMSRLAADGWVTRERDGRLSFYRLNAEGRHAFDEATRRIYAPGPPVWPGQWTTAIVLPDAPGGASDILTAAGFARIGAQSFLRPATAGASDVTDMEGILLVTGKGNQPPGVLGRLWELDQLSAQYTRFVSAWSAMSGAIDGRGGLAGIDAIAVRTLLIHDWRRIVLRDPGLPAELLPAGWPGGEARALARRIYAPLVAPSEAWLDEAGLPAQRDALAFAQRFGIQPEIALEAG
ncbi:MAG: GntR family transcriptional regulator [Notoacmeibacter sp.]|nr:GntR family transcriptional regulator [Notoacmeibacter sp.]